MNRKTPKDRLGIIHPVTIDCRLPEPAPATQCYREGTEFTGSLVDAYVIKPTLDDIVQAVRNFSETTIDGDPVMVWDKRCLKLAVPLLEKLAKAAKRRRKKA